MPLHYFNEVPVFIHELQSVLLISASLDKNAIQSIVNQIVSDRDQHEDTGTRHLSQYHIQEPELGFDIFIRNGEELIQYSFSDKGDYISETPPRDLNESGLFHFQFTVPEKVPEAFHVADSEYKITRITSDEFHSLSTEEQVTMLSEISLFNKIHFPEHFELWDLNNKSTEEVIDHFRHLQMSLSSLYTIRDHEGKMVALNGISATPDGLLTYQSMTLTRTEDRGNGLMAVNLRRATADYPDAIMTAYFVNAGIRHALGADAMTHPNQVNHLHPKRSHYLESKLTTIAVQPLIIQEETRLKQAQIKLEVSEIRRGIRVESITPHDATCPEDARNNSIKSPR